MNLNVTVQLGGAEHLLRRLEQAGSKTERKVATSIAAAAFRIQAAARRVVAWDTGRLRSSIYVNFLEGGMSAEIGTDVFYGPFIEFGTRKMAARPFLIPVWEQERAKLKERLASILGEDGA